MKKSTLVTQVTKLASIAMVGSLVLTGCSSINGLFDKRDNNSLDYQKSRLIEPVKIPNGKKTQPFVPLYPTIDLGESKIDLKNKSGKQFKLPAPERN